MRFERDILIYSLAKLCDEKEKAAMLQTGIVTQIAELPLSVPFVKIEAALIRAAQSNHFWANATEDALDELTEKIGPLMKFKEQPNSGKAPVHLNLTDSLYNKEMVEFGPQHEAVNVTRYREMVENLMLFPFEFMPHKMDKMQSFIDFIFNDVWCHAPSGASFDLSLFDGKPELKEVMILFDHGDTAPGDWFYARIEQIYGLFSTLTIAQITQLKSWYRDNNNIEQACANDPTLQMVKYPGLILPDVVLPEQLKIFFKGLYEPKLLTVKALKDKIGNIDDHYQQFRHVNIAGKCPFCGLNDLKSADQTKREAYDHYLPKALYPFNSINFHNLAPTCHECNSSYKTTKDPLHNRNGHRRKAFYPFSDTHYHIEINIQLSHSSWQTIRPDEIQLATGPTQYQEEIDTWKSVYSIEERYKAKCCSKDDGKEWMVQMMDEWIYSEKTPDQYLATLARQTARNPYADLRFLKKPFLESCNRAGLFNDHMESL
jgi:hypothetical protein